MVNRSAMVLRPKGPYIAWAREIGKDSAFPTGDPAASLREVRTAYLVPRFDDREQAREVLAAWAEVLFELELAQWATDPERWPKA